LHWYSEVNIRIGVNGRVKEKDCGQFRPEVREHREKPKAPVEKMIDGAKHTSFTYKLQRKKKNYHKP
jgi:hypothetical protein